MSKPSICYIGLGLMGLPMARYLVAQGYSVTGFDVVPERVAAAAEAGVVAAASAQEAVRGKDIILLNLPTTEIVEDVVFGANGIAHVLASPQLVVDFSTIKVPYARKFSAALLEASGCGWIDAPVSGGPPASATGTLTIMAGGRDQDFDIARGVLTDVSQQFTVMGPVGSGLVAKMINQMIVGCTHAVLAEAAVLAEEAGIDAALIPQCLLGGHADGSLLQRLYPRMVARDFAPQGYARQLLKDLEMVNEFAGGLKAPAPMTAEAMSLYRMLIHLGHSELDTSAIIKIYER